MNGDNVIHKGQEVLAGQGGGNTVRLFINGFLVTRGNLEQEESIHILQRIFYFREATLSHPNSLI